MDKSEKEKSEDNHLEKLNERYSGYRKKYSLPEFSELNRDFGVEKADADSELFLRELIRGVADKFQNYMRLLENLINPANSSMFAFSLIKLIENGKKQSLNEVYRKLSEFEIKLIKLDLKSSEAEEAEFLRLSYEVWQEIKKELYEIIDLAEKNFNMKPEESKRGYFG